MAITEILVGSVGDLIDQVTPPEPDPVTRRRRDTGVYRGAANAAWSLLTSIDCLGGVHPPHTQVNLEEHILRNFIRYSRPYFPSATNEWELLFAAQHHGLPTRLLDWSYSPLVAAHFATLERGRTSDRVVWRLDWKRVHEAFGFPQLALLIEDLDRLLAKQGRFTPWMLFNIPPHAPHFGCMLEPPSLHPRIVAQSAVFTICSDKWRALDDFLVEHDLGYTLTKFVIPASEVGRFRDQLDLVGADERRLFPDLDGVAAQMRRYYS